MTNNFDRLYEFFSDAAKKLYGRSSKRQQSDRMGNSPWRPVHQNILPAVHKVDPTENSKVEAVRDGMVKSLQLDDSDVAYIVKKYKIDLNDDSQVPKELGTTGIKLFVNNLGKYTIQK
tara:strand:- start:48 stop:401 length:354 start_codon:yes stop_codon:yes gene_type:complete